jgi:formate/nitrite transporter FocA (FNT family)
MAQAWAIYLIWAVSILGWVAVAIYQAAKRNFSKLNFFILVPVISIILFSYVFIFNEGSNVAQFTDRKDLWGFWFQCYFPLSLGNLIGGTAFLVSLVVPVFWKKMRGNVSWRIKLLMLSSMALSLLHILTAMPDC